MHAGRFGVPATLIVLALLLAQAAAGATSASDPSARRQTLLGRSADGRPIFATETGDFDAATRILVVGCVHGNEPAGIAIANRLAHMTPPRELDLWIVQDLNPDGVAARARGNAHGVDLNRNFPWLWEHLSGLFYSGPRPLSEPESRIAVRLIRRARPKISVWFHQRMNVVDESGGDPAVERRYAALVGLPLAHLTREPGSAVGWENHTFRGTTAFVVELPGGSLPAAVVGRYARAVVAVGR